LFQYNVQPAFNLFFGIDGISLGFILLTSGLIMPLCYYIYNTNIIGQVLLRTIELFLLIAFLSLDVSIFFVGFESTLLPIYILIGL